MTVNLSLFAGAGAQFFDNNGNPLAGGLIYSYAAGTTTPQATYTSSSGLISHSNPIVLDSAGRVPNEIWLTAGDSYKFVLQTSSAVTLGTYDDITGANDYTIFSAPTGSNLIGFIQAGIGAVARTAQGKMRDFISVKDFGAVGDGSNDDTAEIQAAIDAAAAYGVGYTGATVYFPPGRYKISSSLTLPGSQFVSLLGSTKASTLLWFGGNNLPMISMDDGTDESKIYIEKLSFLKGNGATGLIGIQMCKTPGNAIVNVTIRDNYFRGMGTALETFTETDQIVFQDNYVLSYASYGIRCRNGICSNFFIRDNHFRDGSATSWAVYHEGGSNILIDGNTVQTGNDGAAAFYLSGVSNWTINNTYFEVSVAPSINSRGLLYSVGSKGGRLESNYTTGAAAFGGYNVVYIDGNSRSIDFGSNYHAVSGGTPYYFAEINSSATNMRATGYQLLTGGIGQWVGGEYIGPILQFANAATTAPLASPSFTGVSSFRRTGLGGAVLTWGESTTEYGSFYIGSSGIGASANGAETGMYIAGTNGTSRSINAGGTVNASGADYAEYMTKAGDFVIAKGDVCGINADGKLTNVFADAVTFVVKSTNPSYVGGDVWGNADVIGMQRPTQPKRDEFETDEQFESAYTSFLEAKAVYEPMLEAARQKVDRIAFAGQVPVNVHGAIAGQYIVAVNENGAIKGLAVSNPSFEQYQNAVGKVIAIEDDGRARIIVKTV